MKPNDDHIQEVLEWCGIKKGSEVMVGGSYGRGVYNWHYPNGLTTTVPPELDLVFVFKHIVPKLLEIYNVESYTFKQTTGSYYTEVSVWRGGSKKHGFEVLHDEHIAKHFVQGFNPDEVAALTYFWAAYLTIQEERKQQQEGEEK